MTAKEIIRQLTEKTVLEGRTCDTFKAGNPDREVHKIAVSMFATVDIIKKAKVWGADMLIVHEPTYYHHYEEDTGSQIAAKKKKLIEESGLVIFRYHDYPHAYTRERDMITDGGMEALGLTGTLTRLPTAASFYLEADSPVTARELVTRMEQNMGLHFVRLAGETDYPTKSIVLSFGTPPGMEEIIENESYHIIMVGEACEWALCERVRDAVSLGMHKSLIVMTHIGSEREGMKLFVKRFSQIFPNIEAQYFECGEVYNNLQ